MKLTNIYFMLVAATGIWAAQSCTSGKSEVPKMPGAHEVVPVEIAAVQKSTTAPVLHISGKVTTEDETVHAFKVGGVVKELFAREGDRISTGQILAALDLTEINARVSQSELHFHKAERDLRRLENLYRDSVVTLEALQNARTTLELARQEVAAAKFNQRHAVITASQNGLVLKRFVSAGQVVAPGTPVIMTNTTSPDNWIFKAGVSARQWLALQGNEKAIISIDAIPDDFFDAVVYRKAGSSDPETGLFTVELKITGMARGLATGMIGTAQVQTVLETDLCEVPYEAVLDANNNEAFVFITRDGKTAIKQAVTIHSFDDHRIAISEGLRDPDKLIVSGSAYLEDGSPITIVK